MRILFLTKYFYPHVGGVEKHVYGVSKKLKANGKRVTILTTRDDKRLKKQEVKDGLKVVRFNYPEIKYVGLIYIWFWLLKNRTLIKQSDVVHCHDVFIWYLPFRFLFPKKTVFTTFHGWEGVWPIPWKNIFLKRLAAKLSRGTIAVGKYIEKYYGVQANIVYYGGTSTPLRRNVEKEKGKIVFVGRLEKDTGVLGFLDWLRGLEHGYKVDFVGDGSLRKECEKYGVVQGFCDPKPYLQKAEYCVPGGYLAALEAFAARCKVKVFWDNPLKKDYWTMAPFYRFIKSGNVEDAYYWARTQTWEKIAKTYLNLWKI